MTSNRYLYLSGIITVFFILVIVKIWKIHNLQLSFADVCNMDLTSAYGTELNEKFVVLENGLYKKPNLALPTLTVSMPYDKGNFNGDLLNDYVFFVYIHSGIGTYTSCDLLLIENKNGKPYFKGKIKTDICDPTFLDIQRNQIILKDISYLEVTEIYEIESGELKLVQRIEEANEP